MDGIFSRSVLLFGEEKMAQIMQAKVIIFGVGGVGSWCAESLVRSGISHLTIIDSDTVNVTNINRQLMATTKTIGRSKVEVLKERLHEINPDAEITAIQAIYKGDRNDDFHLEQYDYIIDCIDSLSDKINLLINATRVEKARVFSSMGAALKIDPTQIKVGEFWKVRGCTLGAAMRKRMRRNKLTLSQRVMCVYSEELLENAVRLTTEGVHGETRQANGTCVHITAIYGFTLAGLVIESIASSPKLLCN